MEIGKAFLYTCRKWSFAWASPPNVCKKIRISWYCLENWLSVLPPCNSLWGPCKVVQKFTAHFSVAMSVTAFGWVLIKLAHVLDLLSLLQEMLLYSQLKIGKVRKFKSVFINLAPLGLHLHRHASTRILIRQGWLIFWSYDSGCFYKSG